MTIRITGSGGSIKLTGTGGGIRMFSSPVAVNSPPLGSMSAWYRADDIGLSNGSSVSSWVDLSGNGADLGPVPGVSQPTYSTNVLALNGRAAVSFSGTEQLRRTSPNFAAGDAAISCYIVCDPTFVGGGGTTLPIFSWGQDFGNLYRPTVLFYNTNPQWIVAVDAYATNSPSYNATSSAQIISFFNGQSNPISTSTILVNGSVPTQFGTGVGGALAIPSPVAEVRMGGFVQNNTPRFIGDIAEVLLYYKNHDAGERAQTLAYLSNRYGIPV